MAASSELITLLEREAAAEREQVLAEARTQAEAVRADARREADELLVGTRSRLEAEARAALVKAQSTAHLRASSRVLQVKEEEIARVFSAAESELARLASDGQRYPDALRSFVEEALQGVSGAAVVTVNPTDQALVADLVRQRGGDVTVRSDPAVHGGVHVASPDGRFMVTNTLTSRLERARPALAAEVAKALWE
ncbi:MAG: V-type ATP synthase subunit E [Armatimonadota bacterium]